MYICKYCEHKFNTISLLTRHQKRAAYCRQLQGIGVEVYDCDCGKKYTLKASLQRHKKVCTQSTGVQLEKQEELLLKVIDKYSEMVKDLQLQITELATKSNQTNNNNNRNMVMQNLQPITDDDLQEHLEVLSLDFIQQGAKGYADFAGNYPLKDKVLCTDRSRKRIRYKNASGELTDDGRSLAKRFFQAISERNTAILNRAYSDLHHEMQTIVANNLAGEVDVTNILARATDLQNILIKSQNAARGEDDEFAQEFLHHLTKML